MVIIQEISRNRSRVSVRLDNGELFWLTPSDISADGCYEGKEYDPETFYQWIRICQYPRALNHAVSMLARRPCSTGEIRRRLVLRHFTEEVADLVLYKLEKENLIDDVSFCEQWIQFRQQRGYGPSLIRRELKYKGVSDDIIETCMDSQASSDDTSGALLLARKAWKKYRSNGDPYKNRQKVIQFLVRKGYDWSTARSAAETAEKE